MATRDYNFVTGVTSATEPTASTPTVSTDLTTKSYVDTAITTTEIARSQVAAGTANHVLINDGTGELSSEATLAKSRGGAGADMSSVTFPSSGTIVTTAGTQTLTNKDIDGGTASNTNRITLPSATKTTLDGLTRKEGTILYATDTDTAYIDNGTVLSAIGSGSGSGLLNYITNGDAETSLIGSTYADAAGTSPVDGTGGSPSTADIDWTRTTTTPIRGTYSFLLEKKNSASQQGKGVSIDFTHPGLVERCQVEFEYNVVSGTFATGDLRIYIVDVSTGAVIEPVNTQVANVGVTTKHIASFQTNLASTSYRLCFHVASASTSNWTLEIDSISVGPQVTTQGAFISDWQSYTPTSSSITNITWTGHWRRVGDSMEVQVNGAVGGSAPVGTSMTVTLPTGYTIDTAKLTNSAFLSALDGTGMLFDTSASAYFSLHVGYSSTTAVFVSYDNGTNGQLVAVQATAPVTLANGDTVSFSYRVPIVGWGTSNSIAGADSGRVVTMKASGNPASASAGNPIIFPTMVYDTLGGYNASTGLYTVKVPGYYFATGAGLSATAAVGLNIYVDAVSTTYAGVTDANGDLTYSGLVYANAGQTISVRPDGTIDLTSAVFNLFLVQGGSQAITAAEKVLVRAYTSTTSVGTSASTVIYSTVDYRSHGSACYDETTGIFTAPRAGVVKVTATASGTSQTSNLNDVVLLAATKNGTTREKGSDLSWYYFNATGVNKTVFLNGSTEIQVNAGDTVRIIAIRNANVTSFSLSDAVLNRVTFSMD